MKITWKTVAPLLIWLALYLVPVPAGLNANQWHYFAIFAAVIAGLILESMPVGAVGIIGLTFAGISGYVEQDPQQGAALDAGRLFRKHGVADRRRLRVLDRLPQERARRRLALLLVRSLGRRTIGLGYAVAFSDLAPAPATPSNTARSGGTIYPIVEHIPRIYGSNRGRRPAGSVRDDVDGVCDHRGDELAVPDRAGAECGGALHRQEDRRRRRRLVERFIGFAPLGMLL